MEFKPLTIKISKHSLTKLCIGIAIAFLLSGCQKDYTPIEGKHYRLLPETLDNTKFSPITEVFSLTCIHCRKMEESIPALQRMLNQDITKMHIVFNDPSYVAAMFYYAAEMQTGKIPDYRFMIELFEAMQLPVNVSEEKQRIAITKVFESRGLTSPIYYDDQQFEKLSKRVAEVERLSNKTQIQSVPTFIVKGKYQVLSATHANRGELAKTITYLLQK